MFGTLSSISVLLLLWTILCARAVTQDRCNEAVCASVVSKCQLLERCNCNSSNSSCTLDCFKCLDYLYMECCSCVSICPKPNQTESVFSMQSHAEDLSEPLPSLFSTLTEEEDQLLRWTTVSFPVQVSFVTTSGSDPKENTFGTGTKVTLTGDGLDEEEDVQTNCTVAFMADCMPFNKCKSSCSSMGASAYRWFHDGCCECVGPNCVNYGVNESKCRLCPVREAGESGPMAVDGSQQPPVARPEEGNDYEAGPVPVEEDSSRQENTVKMSEEEKADREAKSREPSASTTPITTTKKS